MVDCLTNTEYSTIMLMLIMLPLILENAIYAPLLSNGIAKRPQMLQHTPMNTVLIQILQTLTSDLLPIILRHKHTHQARAKHILPINPRMHFHEQLPAIAAGSFHQLRLAARVEGQVWCDVVHLALPRGPSGLAFAAGHAFEH